MGINLNSVANFFVRTRNDDTADGNDGLTAGNPASMASYNADIGYKEETAATTDTGTFSLIQLFKRFLSVKLPIGANTTANALCAAFPTDDALRTAVTNLGSDLALVVPDVDATRVSVASSDTKLTTTNASLASIDGKATTINSSLVSIDTKLGRPYVEVNYSWTRPATITAYTVGDMINDSATTPTVPEWLGLVASAGDTAEIVKATLSCSHNNAYNLRLVLFKASPSSAGDNLPNTISDSDLLTTNCVGFIDFGAVSEISPGAGAAGNAMATYVPSSPLTFSTAATTGLFGAFILEGTVTPVASAVFNCMLTVRRIE